MLSLEKEDEMIQPWNQRAYPDDTVRSGDSYETEKTN